MHCVIENDNPPYDSGRSKICHSHNQVSQQSQVENMKSRVRGSPESARRVRVGKKS